MTDNVENKCGLCGGEVSSAGICSQCGNTVTSERITIKSPDWGRITIDLTLCPGNKDELKSLLINTWKFFEKTTSQKLFSGQPIDSLISNNLIELIGPKESYLVLQRELESRFDMSNEWIKYEALSYDEVCKIRGY